MNKKQTQVEYSAQANGCLLGALETEIMVKCREKKPSVVVCSIGIEHRWYEDLDRHKPPVGKTEED